MEAFWGLLMVSRGAKMTPNRFRSGSESIEGGLESFIEHKPVIVVAPNAETSVAVQ